MKRLHTALLVSLSLAVCGYAWAAGNFVVIRHGSIGLSDASPRLVANFNLPADLNRSNALSNYAVLDLTATGSEFNFNEVYINPPTTVCTSNNADANQARSIGFLYEHDDTNMRSESTTNHFTLNSAWLNEGANQVLICIRSETGFAGPGVGNLDNISVRSIVLHYHTTP
jgi:hypothetical protein